MLRVVVCEAQVPFVHGGAEELVRELVRQLCRRGHEATLVSLPFNGGARDTLISQASAWRLLDLSGSHGQPIDLVIASKFPTYYVRHPNKVTWLIHQHRAAYELFGTRFTNFTESDFDTGIRSKLIELDTEMLAECKKIFSIAKNVSKRLDRFNGLTAKTLYPPPRLAPRLRAGDAGNYLLTVARLEGHKRIDLVIQAMTKIDSSVRLVVVGDGPLRGELQELSMSCGLNERITFCGAVDDEALIEFYAKAIGVVYVPYDEDYGYVTLEAFYAKKPVLTTSDAGGPLEFVVDSVNGFVSDPNPEALANAINRLTVDRSAASILGSAGFESVQGLNWDAVIDQLTRE